jgi:hypothetical protein
VPADVSRTGAQRSVAAACAGAWAKGAAGCSLAVSRRWIGPLQASWQLLLAASSRMEALRGRRGGGGVRRARPPLPPPLPPQGAGAAAAGGGRRGPLGPAGPGGGGAAGGAGQELPGGRNGCRGGSAAARRPRRARRGRSGRAEAAAAAARQPAQVWGGARAPGRQPGHTPALCLDALRRLGLRHCHTSQSPARARPGALTPPCALAMLQGAASRPVAPPSPPFPPPPLPQGLWGAGRAGAAPAGCCAGLPAAERGAVRVAGRRAAQPPGGRRGACLCVCRARLDPLWLGAAVGFRQRRAVAPGMRRHAARAAAATPGAALPRAQVQSALELLLERREEALPGQAAAGPAGGDAGLGSWSAMVFTGRKVGRRRRSSRRAARSRRLAPLCRRRLLPSCPTQRAPPPRPPAPPAVATWTPRRSRRASACPPPPPCHAAGLRAGPCAAHQLGARLRGPPAGGLLHRDQRRRRLRAVHEPPQAVHPDRGLLGGRLQRAGSRPAGTLLRGRPRAACGRSCCWGGGPHCSAPAPRSRRRQRPRPVQPCGSSPVCQQAQACKKLLTAAAVRAA